MRERCKLQMMKYMMTYEIIQSQVEADASPVTSRDRRHLHHSRQPHHTAAAESHATGGLWWSTGGYGGYSGSNHVKSPKMHLNLRGL